MILPSSPSPPAFQAWDAGAGACGACGGTNWGYEEPPAMAGVAPPEVPAMAGVAPVAVMGQAQQVGDGGFGDGEGWDGGMKPGEF